MKLHHIISLVLVNIILIRCANPIALTGGDKDVVAPSIDTLKSTLNNQTNFEIQDIELYFDEFIELKDIFRNVVISPPLSKNPKITSRGKKLSLEFDENEILKEDATYVINFGDAIRDFTEGNIVKNYSYVFSTGDYIDSLEITGNVVDVKTGNPVENVSVMLYDNLADTVVRTERPFYFSSTDKSGNFTIKNLRADTFKIFALLDGNLNYLYDQESEAIGFINDFVIVPDTNTTSYEIELFTAKPEFKIKEKVIDHFGEMKLLFTNSPDDVVIGSSISELEFRKEIDKDTLLLWYDMEKDSSFSVYASRTSDVFADTIPVRKYKRSDFLIKQKLNVKKTSLNSAKKLMPDKGLAIAFSYPLEKVNKDSISLTLDSLPVNFEIDLDTNSLRSALINAEWIPDTTYVLDILDGAVSDIYGHTNDSTRIEFEVVDKDILSKIIMNYSELKDTINYTLILIRGSEEVTRQIISDSTEGQMVFAELTPGSYKFEIIEDVNKNGEWDPGNYDLKLQSERTITKELEEMRENWDLEVILTRKDFEKTIVQDTIK